MTPRMKAGLLGLLNHRNPVTAARWRKELGASADPEERALLKTTRDRSSGLLNGPRRADRVEKFASKPGGNDARQVAGQGKADRPGIYDFTHLARAAHQRAAVEAAASEPASPSADAAARQMLMAAGIVIAPTGLVATPWQPAQPKIYPSADAAARANLAAAGITLPKAGVTKR